MGWAVLPTAMTRYKLPRWLRELQDRSGEIRKITSPPRFDHQIFQPVACCEERQIDSEFWESLRAWCESGYSNPVPLWQFEKSLWFLSRIIVSSQQINRAQILFHIRVVTEPYCRSPDVARLCNGSPESLDISASSRQIAELYSLLRTRIAAFRVLWAATRCGHVFPPLWGMEERAWIFSRRQHGTKVI